MTFASKLARAFFALVFGLWVAGAVALRAARGDEPGSRDILTRVDKLCAHTLGWTDLFTVSAWCGSEIRRGCRLCRFIRALFKLLGNPTHCDDAARAEDLLPQEAK